MKLNVDKSIVIPSCIFMRSRHNVYLEASVLPFYAELFSSEVCKYGMNLPSGCNNPIYRRASRHSQHLTLSWSLEDRDRYMEPSRICCTDMGVTKTRREQVEQLNYRQKFMTYIRHSYNTVF